MLVLTRKAKESITIGHNITVTVLDVRGSQVRLGIQAPLHTPVNRTEIYENILKENVRASRSPKELGPFLEQWPGKGDRKE